LSNDPGTDLTRKIYRQYFFEIQIKISNASVNDLYELNPTFYCFQVSTKPGFHGANCSSAVLELCWSSPLRGKGALERSSSRVIEARWRILLPGNPAPGTIQG
jgi:hypothetical protein